MITKDLLSRYRQRKATQEELALLQRYFSKSEHVELERFLDEEWESLSLHETGDDETGARVWNRLESSTYSEYRKVDKVTQNGRRSSFIFRHAGWVAGVAACVLLIVFAAVNHFTREDKTRVIADNYVLKANTDSKPIKVTLSDGSVVWLAARSNIRYQNPFKEGYRNIDLDGEAYFEIERDTLHPFTVNTKSLVVRVLGTSFTVNSFAENDAAQVSVRSGKVSVSVLGQKSDVILRPNERVSFSGKMKLVKELVESPVIVHAEAIPNQFEFTSTPIPDIFKLLEKAYEVHIKFDEKLLEKCTLTAKLGDQTLFTKLDMICASIGGSYVVEGTEILITAPGCNEN
jgi:transmembrane sensor